MKNWFLHYRVLGNLGIIYLEMGHYDKGKRFLEDALDIQRKIGDKYGAATQLRNLGSTYLKLGKKEKAIRYLKQAKHLFEEVGATKNVNEMENLISNLKKSYFLVSGKDIKTSSSGIEKKIDNILYKLDGQDRILNEILLQKQIGKVSQNQPCKKQP